MSLFLFISLKAEEARELGKKYAEEKGVRDCSELDVVPNDEEARRSAREMMDDFM